MRDIRLLTLYKQHYLDHYIKPLQSQITCLGYYDGLDIEVIEDNNASSSNASNFPLSTIWYATGEKIKSITGGHGNQHIGIFRDHDNEISKKSTEFFWDEAQKLPFCSIGFVKLKEEYQKDYQKIKQHIETIYCTKKDVQKERVCYVLPYYTFDNADLIILLRANSMIALDKTQHDIEKIPKIAYLHSILGIDEKYVELCHKKKKILPFWNNINCFTNDIIENLELQIATSGDSKILNCLKQQLESIKNTYPIENYANIKYAYICGHASISIKLDATNVATLVIFMLPNGFATHQNPLYGNGVYNIKSSVCMKNYNWSTLSAATLSDSQAPKNPTQKRWCLKILEQCKEQIANLSKENDETMYSLFLALIRTLNNLDQYEGFAISKDIFYMIAPSFSMFHNKFKKTLEKEYLNNPVSNEMVKISMRDYLEYVNSVVYHTIHMDQRYLMVPGCSETSYSLPIKLQMFYLWFAEQISNLLNDNGRNYSCILSTVMESRPQTKCIELIPDDIDKIICVRLSQRSLFFPKHLMLIITHELAHYTGKAIRCRTCRIEHIIPSILYTILEGIIPTDYRKEGVTSQKEKTLFITLTKEIKNNLAIKMADEINQKFPTMFYDKEYHAKDIEKPLIKTFKNLLSDTGSGQSIQDILYTIPDEIINDLNLKENFDEYLMYLQFINKIQTTLDLNRKQLLISDVINKIVTSLICVYQEVFSDLAAVTILECTPDDYKETFSISEGVNISKKGITKEQQLREYIIQKTVFNLENATMPIQKHILEFESKAEEIYANLYYYTGVQSHLLAYAKECYKSLCTMRDNNRANVEIVKDKYNMFTSSQMTTGQIYEEMQQCIQEYKIKQDLI